MLYDSMYETVLMCKKQRLYRRHSCAGTVAFALFLAQWCQYDDTVEPALRGHCIEGSPALSMQPLFGFGVIVEMDLY